jgi:NADH-quinone oxidoreductase subunit E
MTLGDALRAEIDELAAQLPARHAALLPALHLVQRANGCISRDAMRELASHLGLRPVEVLEVVTFCDEFTHERRGRHAVRVCTSLGCSLRGGRTLLAQLEARLGIGAGEITADGLLSLDRAPCLGACAGAPLLRVDAIDHTEVDFERACQLLSGLE